MNKIDTERIKSMTNELIGYENYKREKKMKREKIRNITFVMVGAITLSLGTLTVDALSNMDLCQVFRHIFLKDMF